MANDFRVIIVGGSITGLVLALCLEKAGVDYVVLEKHQNIRPVLGGLLVMQPHAVRILEQLGLLDSLIQVSEPLAVSHIGFPGGALYSHRWPRDVEERHGLPMYIVTRHQLLQVLYNAVQDKARVHVNRTVVSIDSDPSGVSVRTEQGIAYQGDVAVGADGVHSRTRSELWRLATEAGLEGAFTSDMHAFYAEYKCVVGIADAVPGMVPGEQGIRSYDQLVIYVVIGQDGVVGWALMQKMHQRHIFPDIPRYTQKDGEAMCEKFKELPVWNGVKMGDVWKARRSFAMISMEENILHQWNFDRLVCIGDSSNKMSPTFGQGANMAIESAAALANHLHSSGLTQCPRKPSHAEVVGILADFSRSHHERAKSVGVASYAGMRLHARDGLIPRLLGQSLILRYECFAIWVVNKIILDGVTLDYLPLLVCRRWGKVSWMANIVATLVVVLGAHISFW